MCLFQTLQYFIIFLFNMIIVSIMYMYTILQCAHFYKNFDIIFELYSAKNLKSIQLRISLNWIKYFKAFCSLYIAYLWSTQALA